MPYFEFLSISEFSTTSDKNFVISNMKSVFLSCLLPTFAPCTFFSLSLSLLLSSATSEFLHLVLCFHKYRASLAENSWNKKKLERKMKSIDGTFRRTLVGKSIEKKVYHYANPHRSHRRTNFIKCKVEFQIHTSFAFNYADAAQCSIWIGADAPIRRILIPNEVQTFFFGYFSA